MNTIMADECLKKICEASEDIKQIIEGDGNTLVKGNPSITKRVNDFMALPANQTNFRGPQGLQGPQGIQGLKGDTAPTLFTITQQSVVNIDGQYEFTDIQDAEVLFAIHQDRFYHVEELNNKYTVYGVDSAGVKTPITHFKAGEVVYFKTRKKVGVDYRVIELTVTSTGQYKFPITDGSREILYAIHDDRFVQAEIEGNFFVLYGVDTLGIRIPYGATMISNKIILKVK